MGEREVIITIYRSAGNSEVGEMWRETKIFVGGETVTNILEWVDKQTNDSAHKTRIELTVAL